MPSRMRKDSLSAMHAVLLVAQESICQRERRSAFTFKDSLDLWQEDPAWQRTILLNDSEEQE